MPYISVSQLTKALESLQRFHAFFGVTLLSMKQTGVSVGSATIWGSQQEEALLGKYFSPPGAPPGKPYCVPFGRKDPVNWFWKNAKYSGGTLQSARSRDAYSEALVHPTDKEWAFDPDYIEKLAKLLPAGVRLPVFDLAAWLYRSIELPASLDEVEERFREEFRIDNTEYQRLFDSTRPDASHYFSPTLIQEEEVANLIHGVPPGPTMAGRTEEDLLRHIEHWVMVEEGLALPPGFVSSFYSALLTQRFVILAGRPGTGKTAFVRAYSNALKEFFANTVELVEVSVGSDFSESDVLGYEKISGGLSSTELSETVFLSERPKDIYVVLLDEMNLSQVDHYLARLLPALESDAHVSLPGKKMSVALPADFFVVGTVNSFIEEPTRFQLSSPVKRRANIIEMPNALDRLVATDRREEFDKACIDLIRQTRKRIERRGKGGFASVLDSFRLERLNAALQPESELRSTAFGNALWGLCKICAGNESTSLTFGVVQDVLDYAAMSGRTWEASLAEQIAFKLVPQLSGPSSVGEELLTFIIAIAEGNSAFDVAISSLKALLRTKDVGTGYVVYRY
jgi:hypothetical protein